MKIYSFSSLFYEQNILFSNIIGQLFLNCNKKQEKIMISEAKITEVVSKIAKDFNPEKIILFGSYANGTANENSDLDLIVIQETDQPRHKRGIDIQFSFKKYLFPIDLLVYTRNEFEIDKKNRYTFLNSALKKSKLLYER